MKITNLLTQADREVFDRIDRDCLSMHVPPPPKTFLKLEVRNKAGELTDVYEDRAHSWVRNGYILLSNFTIIPTDKFGSVVGAGYLALARISDGVAQSGDRPARLNTPADSYGLASDSSSGIVVGTGTAAESFDSYKLTAQVVHGNSAGQMAHQAGAITATYDAGAKKYTSTISRVFNNNSGASIVVAEAGIIANLQYGIASTGDYLVCRDLLAETKTVPNAGQLTVTYTIKMTFPE